MAYDSNRQRIVLFGGALIFNNGNNVAYLADTWEWDGATWQQPFVSTGSSPPPRAGHAMAYDPVRNRVVLFGGADTAHGAFSDTWEWDGTTWIQRTPSNSPPGGAGGQMAYDPGRQRIVHFGGGMSSDIWEWTGSNWTNSTPDAGATPEGRGSPALAFDQTRGRLVIFGGSGTTTYYLNDTWEWDGATWMQNLASTKPSGRIGPAMTFDPIRKRIVLFGGSNPAGARDDTWEYGP